MLPKSASASSATEAPDVFDALGDRHRRTILRLLGEGERNVTDLAASMPISRPAVSRHLRVLREAGLVQERPMGTQRIYALRESGIEAVRAYLDQVWGDAAARYRLFAENTSDRPR
jgi:DNA-binding transcriptional ArsR family regulator